MSGTQPTRVAHEPQALNRRRALRVLGALAAAAAGAAALNAARPEDAEAYVLTQQSTQFSGPIMATGNNVTVPNGATVIGANTSYGVGVYGYSSGYGVGVYGSTNNAVGNATVATGVYGVTNMNGFVGVYGEGQNGGTGVIGSSDYGWGVYGSTSDLVFPGVEGANSGGGPGVYGKSTANSPPGQGVYGNDQGSNPGGAGVYGISDHGTGVYGQSNHLIGVWGVTSSSGQGLANPAVAGSNDGGGAGLVGFTTGPSSIGLGGATDSGIGAYGSSQSGIGLFGYSNTGFAIEAVAAGGGYAGYFNGPVFVTGSLTAMGAKSAAVKTKGGLSRVYSLESPESWFEDFGSGQLTGGQAAVSLEPGFADIVHIDTYHVFLTAYGDSQGLYVSERHGSGFTVREQQGGRSNTAFDYRVVAKRADIAGARLEHIDPPHPIDGPHEPALDHAPKPPPNQAPAPSQVPGTGNPVPGH